MASLNGKTPADTFKDLLQVSNSNSGVDGTLRTVSDGEGTDSSLQISSTAVHVAGAISATTGLGLALLDTKTASASSSIEFTSSIDSTYRAYVIGITGLQPSTGAILYMTTSADAGVSYGTDYDFHTQNLGNASASYAAIIGTTATQISLTGTISAAGSPDNGGFIVLNNPSTTSNNVVRGSFTYLQTSNDASGGDVVAYAGGGIIDAVKFTLNTGTLTVGTFKLYGVR